MELWQLATSSVVASVLAFALNYGLTRRTLMAKLNDRLFDLDKLILGNASAFATFWGQGDRERDDYFATAFAAGAPTEDVIKHRTIAFYYLNLFEEMYLAHHMFGIESQDWSARERYLCERLKHPLIRETLLTSAGITRDRSVLVASDTGQYSRAFIAYLCANERKWTGPRNRGRW